MRKRDIKKNFWFNEKENKRLKVNAKKVGLSESAYIRNLVMGYTPKEQPNELYFQFIKELQGIGKNLNQVAIKANALNFIDTAHYKRAYKNLCELEEKIKNEILGMK